MRFLDVKTDFAFKKVFGSEDSKDILLSFLNAVDLFDGRQKIASLTIVDPYNIPMLKGMKDTFVDVKAVLDDGSHVIIEMQVLNTEGFEKHVLYNAAKKYASQLKKGDSYRLLNPVIALTITDFVLFEELPDVISRFKLMEKREMIEYMDDIELVFIELPKFKKAEVELAGILDKWIYFIKNAGSLDYIPKHLDAELNRAFEIANEANFSEMELDLQHRKKDWVYMQKSSIDLAKKQGIEQGIEQGLEQGLEQGIEQGAKQSIEQVVIKSLHAGMKIQTIAQITGLDEKKLQDIMKRYEEQ
jgi:predicted transposase/invertase (TIGR01784 family)